MAKKKAQQIGILILAGVMLVGTLGSFAVMILANSNSQTDVAEQRKMLEEYQKQMEEQEKKRQEEGEKLSKKYYAQFAKYKDSPKEFDRDNVGDKVITKDIVTGKGDAVSEDTTYRAYYVGWNPKGKTFDSSIDGKKLKAPIDTAMFDVIPGWKQGVKGMKVGGVREITIPSDLAYGEKGQGNDIPPNTPLKFIIMIIEADKQG